MEGKEVMVALYTVILGRPLIHTMGAVPSTLHVKVKFCTEQGIAMVRGN